MNSLLEAINILNCYLKENNNTKTKSTIILSEKNNSHHTIFGYYDLNKNNNKTPTHICKLYNFQKNTLLKETGDINYVESKYGKTFEDWIPLQIKYLKDNKSHLLVDSRNSESKQYKILRLLQEQNEGINKINAKYDAELDALKNPAKAEQAKKDNIRNENDF